MEHFLEELWQCGDPVVRHWWWEFTRWAAWMVCEKGPWP